MSYYQAGGMLDTLENLLGGGKNTPASNAITKGGNAVADAVKKSLTFGASGLLSGHGRRHRHMHVTNVKALRRAMRRVQGFAHLAKHTINFTHQVKMKHHRKRR